MSRFDGGLNQRGDGGGFRMLQRKTGQCECHGGVRAERVYRWHAFWYCLMCLHSIGRNAAGNECKLRQYRATRIVNLPELEIELICAKFGA